MTSEPRPVCVNALNGLKKNGTKLVVTMCVGIALAFYGIYIQNRRQSNPSYEPAITMATHWLYNALGEKLSYPKSLLLGCSSNQTGKNSFKQTVPNFLMRAIIKPIVHRSGIMNGFINVGQIILLKLYCRNVRATKAIIGLSAAGLLISMICFVESFVHCKWMCISCLGIHHIFIIYLAVCRLRIIKNLYCPPSNTNEGACVFGSGASASSGSSSGGSSGQIFGQSSVSPVSSRGSNYGRVRNRRGGRN